MTPSEAVSLIKLADIGAGDVGNTALLGAGGVMTQGSVSHLLKQLRTARNYNPYTLVVDPLKHGNTVFNPSAGFSGKLLATEEALGILGTDAPKAMGLNIGSADNYLDDLLREGDLLTYSNPRFDRDAARANTLAAGKGRPTFSEVWKIRQEQGLKPTKLNKLKELLGYGYNTTYNKGMNAYNEAITAFEGGMGGLDAHSEFVTKHMFGDDVARNPFMPKGNETLRSTASGQMIGKPKGSTLGQRSPRYNVAKKFLTGGFGSLTSDPKGAWGKAKARLDKVMKLNEQLPAAEFTSRYNLMREESAAELIQRLMAPHGERGGDRAFSVVRPGQPYNPALTRQSMLDTGHVSFGIDDQNMAGIRRRFTPRWLTDLVEKLTGTGYASNCAGGSCRHILGKGIYNIPSDIRYLPNTKVVSDIIPDTMAAEFGTLKNLRKYMGRGARMTSLPGIAAGLGIGGLGAYGLLNRKSKVQLPKWRQILNSMAGK